MARIVAGVASSHVPAIGAAIDNHRTSEPYWQRVFEGFERSKEWMAKAKPDVCIVVYNDHASAFSVEMIPTFALGTAAEFPIAAGTIDFLVHSIAFADKDWLKEGMFTATPRQVFTQAMDISAYTYAAMANRAAPLMTNGGSMIALSYYGAEKAVPGYNVMGVAKAALEATNRYLAMELGQKNIRCNVISAGPMRTLSAMAVGGFSEILGWVEKKAPLRRNITTADVGGAAAWLLSPLANGVTGETLYVDSGYAIMGL